MKKDIGTVSREDLISIGGQQYFRESFLRKRIEQKEMRGHKAKVLRGLHSLAMEAPTSLQREQILKAIKEVLKTPIIECGRFTTRPNRVVHINPLIPRDSISIWKTSENDGFYAVHSFSSAIDGDVDSFVRVSKKSGAFKMIKVFEGVDGMIKYAKTQGIPFFAKETA